jgi:ATP-dependent Zn protease
MQILISILPFLALLALWFFLLKRMGKGAETTKKNFIDPMQEMLERAIVPEIRALRQSVDSLREEMKNRG